MTECATAQLAPWANFYVIVGSAAAALISVQFVVIALIASTRTVTTADAVHAFGTPTVVHLGAALLVSALMSAPWYSCRSLSVALAVCGLVGFGYGAIVIRRARRQTAYAPVWEDWVWFAILPFVLYAALAFGGLFLRTRTYGALFVVAVAALGMLLIGIHNAWDTVTHIVVQGSGDGK